MTAIELFTAAGPLVGPALEGELGRRDLCILSTRVVLDIGKYFGVDIEPVAVRAVVYNRAFAAHVNAGYPQGPNVREWGDSSWSVGVGFGIPLEHRLRGTCWDGHLIATGDGAFGDFSIWNAERPEHDIVLGPAVIGPYRGETVWECVSDRGTVVYYERIEDGVWRLSPDWNTSSLRPLVRRIIRRMRKNQKGRIFAA